MVTKMRAAILPGNSTVELKDFEVPKPGHGEVLIKTRATTICGSDIRCIYREHVGKGPEGYIPGMAAGHEPCGEIVEEGEGLRRFKKGDRSSFIIYRAAVFVTTADGDIISLARVNTDVPTDGSETAVWPSISLRKKRIL